MIAHINYELTDFFILKILMRAKGKCINRKKEKEKERDTEERQPDFPGAASATAQRQAT